MIHRHLDSGFEDSPAAIEDVLERGTLDDWKELAAKVRRDPFGREAMALRTVLDNTHLYGTTTLWNLLLAEWREGRDPG
ncbi:MAG: hypothetical protein AB1714_13915 [Acidobacteriota bacterium]